MKIAVLLHSAAVIRGPQPLHPTDVHVIRLWRQLGAEIVVLELLGASGVTPRAITEAIEAGVDRAVRLVAEPLGLADAHGTGLVVERYLRTLNPDVVAFGVDADPDGLADVPGVVATRLGAAYVPGVVEIARRAGAEDAAPNAAGADAASAFEVVADRAGVLARLALPPRAVVGFEGESIVKGVPELPADVTPRGPAAPQAIRIMTLYDLGLEPTLIRRGDDLRGTVEAASRPLVMTKSAESLATLLR
jgi:hypothetical protein